MDLSLSLGLGSRRGRARSVSPQETICTAIKDRKHVVAALDGRRVIFQPYAVLPGAAGAILDAILVLDERDPVRNWRPQAFRLVDISAAELHHLTFIPHGAFRATSARYRQAVCVVEAVQSFDNALKAQSSVG